MKTLTIDPERLARIQSVPIRKGDHSAPPNGECEVCIMEALAYVTRQPHRDRDVCASPIIESFLRSWNDGLSSDADRDRILKPLIPRLIGIKGGKSLEDSRFWMICDWLIREFTPPWLRLAKLVVEADAISSLAEIVGPESIESSLRAISIAKIKAAAARAAARAAAWAAARTAAGDAIKSTVDALQVSALALINRMIDLGDSP